jgi:hypothetical protein
MGTPDFKRLQELSEEVDRLADAKKYDRPAFNRIREQARKAANGSELHGLTEFVYLFADPDWLT